MMGFIKFMQKRPTDKTIKVGRILFGLILSAALYYNFFYTGDTLETNFFWSEVNESYITYIQYFFIALGIIPIVMGATNICLLKKKYMRYVQVFFGIILFYISSKIVLADPNKLDVDTLLFLMAFLPIIAGITGKCITSNCMKYAEKITKIRV